MVRYFLKATATKPGKVARDRYLTSEGVWSVDKLDAWLLSESRAAEEKRRPVPPGCAITVVEYECRAEPAQMEAAQ